VGSAQTVVMLVKVHHLKPVELSRDLLDLLRFAWLLDFDSFGIPIASQQKAEVESASLQTIGYIRLAQIDPRRLP